VFWANTEVILDLLTKKGQHVEQFIGFASKPRLMARFRERMEEYKRFWEGVRMMCSNYIVAVENTNNNDRQKMYGFLEKSDGKSIGEHSGGDSLDSLSNNSGFDQSFGMGIMDLL
jgi:DNA-binding LacI/PurR family transcriptional regulator